MVKIFRDRVEAGQLLAEKLMSFKGRKDAIILALPRGGVPVGYEIAQALEIPLDIFLVRKLGVPWHEELAFGAIALGGGKVFNQQIITMLGLTQPVIDEVIHHEQQVLIERNEKYRGNRPLPDFKNRTVIVVDDGIATGATLQAAVMAIRQLGCRQLVTAVPVAPLEAEAQFKPLVDQFVCLETPAELFAIGSWYADFSQTTDEEVYRLLGHSTNQPPC
jgi:putative phosphoribosyl transferase